MFLSLLLLSARTRGVSTRQRLLLSRTRDVTGLRVLTASTTTRARMGGRVGDDEEEETDRRWLHGAHTRPLGAFNHTRSFVSVIGFIFSETFFLKIVYCIMFSFEIVKACNLPFFFFFPIKS